jgi:hypothetical protein
MNPIAMAGSRLGMGKHKYSSLERGESEELSFSTSRRPDGTPHFVIDDDDNETEDFLEGHKPKSEQNLRIVSSLRSKLSSETFLSEGDRVEMYTTGSLVDCSTCCPSHPLKSAASPLGIYKSSTESSYLTRERTLQLTATRVHRKRDMGGKRFSINAADDLDWAYMDESDMKAIGTLSMSPASKTARQGKEREWTVTNTQTGRLFRFRVSTRGILHKTISVYHAGERIGKFVLQRQASDLLRLRLTWNAQLMFENDSELSFLLLCFQIVQANTF